jgi:hypothetical protein
VLPVLRALTTYLARDRPQFVRRPTSPPSPPLRVEPRNLHAKEGAACSQASPSQSDSRRVAARRAPLEPDAQTLSTIGQSLLNSEAETVRHERNLYFRPYSALLPGRPALREPTTRPTSMARSLQTNRLPRGALRESAANKISNTHSPEPCAQGGFSFAEGTRISPAPILPAVRLSAEASSYRHVASASRLNKCLNRPFNPDRADSPPRSVSTARGPAAGLGDEDKRPLSETQDTLVVVNGDKDSGVRVTTRGEVLTAEGVWSLNHPPAPGPRGNAARSRIERGLTRHVFEGHPAGGAARARSATVRLEAARGDTHNFRLPHGLSTYRGPQACLQAASLRRGRPAVQKQPFRQQYLCLNFFELIARVHSELLAAVKQPHERKCQEFAEQDIEAIVGPTAAAMSPTFDHTQVAEMIAYCGAFLQGKEEGTREVLRFRQGHSGGGS